jgi:hypothetical protein
MSVYMTFLLLSNECVHIFLSSCWIYIWFLRLHILISVQQKGDNRCHWPGHKSLILTWINKIIYFREYEIVLRFLCEYFIYSILFYGNSVWILNRISYDKHYYPKINIRKLIAFAFFCYSNNLTINSYSFSSNWITNYSFVSEQCLIY